MNRYREESTILGDIINLIYQKELKNLIVLEQAIEDMKELEDDMDEKKENMNQNLKILDKLNYNIASIA